MLKGRTALAFDNLELKNYFSNDPAGICSSVSAALIVPIYLDKSEIELLGVIIIFEFFNSLISDEENVLTMETIAGHIAPILYNLRIIEEQNTLLIPNYVQYFKNDLENEIKQAEEYNLDLCILKILSPGEFSFNKADIASLLKPRFPKIYPLSYNTIYVITNEKVNSDGISDEIGEITGIGNLTVKADILGKDFNSYAEFVG